MSGNGNSSNDWFEPGQDAELRDLLETTSVETSQAHDQAILSAAKKHDRPRSGNRSSVSSIEHRREARAARRKWYVPAAFAAGAAIVVLALNVNQTPRAVLSDPGVVRNGVGVVVEPVDGSALSGAPSEVSWPEQPGATSYRVVLRDASAEELWTSAAVSDSKIELPEEVRVRFEQRGTYLWTVEVHSTRDRKELGPFWFKVEAANP